MKCENICYPRGCWGKIGGGKPDKNKNNKKDSNIAFLIKHKHVTTLNYSWSLARQELKMHSSQTGLCAPVKTHISFLLLVLLRLVSCERVFLERMAERLLVAQQGKQDQITQLWSHIILWASRSRLFTMIWGGSAGSKNTTTRFIPPSPCSGSKVCLVTVALVKW